MTHDITLIHLNASRSDRIFWLLEEVKLPYNVQVHFRLPTRSAPPALHKVSPLGKAPALVLDGETLIESAFIIRTVLDLPEVREAANNGEIDVQVEQTKDDVFWGHFAEASMMNLFQAGAIIGATTGAWASGQVPGVSDEGKQAIGKYGKWVAEEYLKPQQQGALDFANSALEKNGGKYFSGTDKPGESDFMLYFAFNSLLNGARKDAGFKIGDAIRAWFEKISARPALQKAHERLRTEEEKAKSKI